MVILLHRPAQPAESVGDINPFSQGPPQRDTAFALLLGAAEGSSCIPGCIGMVSEASNTIRARTENNANPVVCKGGSGPSLGVTSAPQWDRDAPARACPPRHEILARAGGRACVDVFVDERVGDRVVVAVELDVIVDADADADLPVAVDEGLRAGDVLHDRDGALDHERDRVGVGADAVARGPGRRARRAEESGVNAMEATTASCASPHSIAESSRRGNTKTPFHLLTDQPPSLPGPP